MSINKKVAAIVSRIRRNSCTNNTQKVLLSLLNANNDGWVSRSSLRVPSVTSRIRDLRKSKFGGFNVVCKTAKALNRKSRSQVVRPTYYRIDPRSVTVSAVKAAFRGVI